MTKLLSGVLMAAVLSMGLPMTAASARDNDRGDRGDHGRHCRLVKKTIWKHGHRRVVFKKVCTRGWHHRHH